MMTMMTTMIMMNMKMIMKKNQRNLFLKEKILQKMIMKKENR